MLMAKIQIKPQSLSVEDPIGNWRPYRNQTMSPNHRLQATHKSASAFFFFLARGAALLCAPEPKC
jgi:hypothetical protein